MKQTPTGPSQPSLLLSHLEKLPYFVAIAKAGSLRKAAEELRVTQPSLSRAIQVLEDVQGGPLFLRGPRGVTLTSIGKNLLTLSNALLKTVADHERNRHFEPQQIKIVTHELLVPILFPSLLKYLEGSLVIETAPSVRTLVEKVRSEDADFGIVGGCPAKKGLHFEKLFSDDYAFFCLKDSVYRRQFKKWSDWDPSIPLIFAPQALAGANETLAAHLRSRGLVLRPSHIVGSHESVATLTASGLGVGLLPKKIGSRILPDGMIPLAPTADRPLGRQDFNFVCTERDWKNSSSIRALFHKILETTEELFS